jgi:adenylate cyclase
MPYGNGWNDIRELHNKVMAAYKKALTRNPNLLPAHLGLATIYSELGREEEARAEAAEVLRLNPKYSLEVLRQMTPFKDPAVIERMVAALRKAGLK